MSDRGGTAQRPTLSLQTPIQFVPGVGPKRGESMIRLGLRTAQQALFFFPRDYELPPPPATVENLSEGVEASLVGQITEVELSSRTPGKSVFGALVQTASGFVRMLFFNQAFRVDTLRRDQRVLLSGKPRLNGLRWEFVHPKVTLLDDDEAVPRPRPLAIYPLTEGLRQADLRKTTDRIAKHLAHTIPEVMPASLRQRAADRLRAAGLDVGESLPEIGVALEQIHAPESERQIHVARARFAFQELLVMQLALAMRRRQLTTDLKAPPIEVPAAVDRRIRDGLGFELTGYQNRVIAEIVDDLRKQFPMNRLLQGDVGSGKTAVAIYCMLAAAAEGYQSVLMAPTEVLARQHEASLREALRGRDMQVGLLCGSLGTRQRRQVLAEVADGSIPILIGTQALIYGEVTFAKLGLCIVDEQHKFGVQQRVAFRQSEVDPHYLVMSATPIPRSVAMTVFGDVDLSTIREKPAGRGIVNTYLVDNESADRWWEFVAKSVAQGRQAFVVAPRVLAGEAGESGEAGENTEGSGASEFSTDLENTGLENTDLDDTNPEDTDSGDTASVESVYRELSQGPLANLRLAPLHGRMDAETKIETMRRFADREIDVLVSTTVIEVGVNVPNATLMTILGAQRFGLAQLHQLRGRVSRGMHAGHVAVMTDGPRSPEDHERLTIFQQSNDGFELAEADFRIRGPGDLLGSRQSGLPPMRVADLQRDALLVDVAQTLAREMVENDPELAEPELEKLRQQVLRRYEQRLQLGDAS